MARTGTNKRLSCAAVKAKALPDGSSGKPPVFIHLSFKQGSEPTKVAPKFLAACLAKIDGHYRRLASAKA